MTAEQERAAVVAKGLTKGAARAITRMTADWQFPGKVTFEANGAHNAYWRTGKGKVVEMEYIRPDPFKRITRAAYRLTPLGLAVREHLRGGE